MANADRGLRLLRHALPNLAGYILGDWFIGAVWLPDERPRPHGEHVHSSPFIEIVTFGQDRDGELYLRAPRAKSTGSHRAVPPVGDPPALLSQLGVSPTLRALTPAPGVVSLRCEHAALVRRGAWRIDCAHRRQTANRRRVGRQLELSVGTVFVKHFELEQADGSDHRLETRFLVHGKDAYYGVTYRWRPDNSDADLQDPKAFLEKLGGQTWHYPSRSECGRCHNSSANYVLGLKTAQFNRPLYYPSSGLLANMVSTLQGLGLFKTLMPACSTNAAPTRERHRVTALALPSTLQLFSVPQTDGPARGNRDGRWSTPPACSKSLRPTRSRLLASWVRRCWRPKTPMPPSCSSGFRRWMAQPCPRWPRASWTTAQCPYSQHGSRP